MRTLKTQYGGTSDAYKNDNHPMPENVWATVKDIAKKGALQQEIIRS